MMNDQEIRMECVRNAINISMMTDNQKSVLENAQELYAFVTKAEASAETLTT